MNDLTKIHNGLQSILEFLKTSDNEFESLSKYLYHREYGVAFESLCWMIKKKDIVLPKQYFLKIEELFNLMDGENDPDWIEIKLKALIQSIKVS